MPRWFWIVLGAFALVYVLTTVIAGSTDALVAGLLIVGLIAVGGALFTALGRRGGEPRAAKRTRPPVTR